MCTGTFYDVCLEEVCDEGYEGSPCADIDECAAGTDNCDETTEICVNTDGSFTCACMTGYDGSPCTDIDECADGTEQCEANEACVNTLGSFSCKCKDGYVKITHELIVNLCDEIEQCALDQEMCDAITKTCENTDGSFTYLYKTDYTREVKSGVDINECDTGTHTCGSHQECSNIDGSFTCETKGRFLHFLFTIIRNFL